MIELSGSNMTIVVIVAITTATRDTCYSCRDAFAP